MLPEEFEKELYLSFGSVEDSVDLMNFTASIDFDKAFYNSILRNDGDLEFRIIHYQDLILNKMALNRNGNESLIDQYDVSELKKIFELKS